MNYYNVRNSLGQFTRRAPVARRSSSIKGQTPASNPNKVVAGRLYNFKGATVRALQPYGNGQRLVSFHKTLFGFVNDTDLSLIDSSKVQNYLAHA